MNTGNLDVRSRYYHSEMDNYQIRAGESYDDLKQSIVIFLCDFDMFHKNRSVYTFKTRCDEDPEILLNDRRKTIFVNLNGKRDGLCHNHVGRKNCGGRFCGGFKGKVCSGEG